MSRRRWSTQFIMCSGHPNSFSLYLLQSFLFPPPLLALLLFSCHNNVFYGNEILLIQEKAEKTGENKSWRWWHEGSSSPSSSFPFLVSSFQVQVRQCVSVFSMEWSQNLYQLNYNSKEWPEDLKIGIKISISSTTLFNMYSFFSEEEVYQRRKKMFSCLGHGMRWWR